MKEMEFSRTLSNELIRYSEAQREHATTPLSLTSMDTWSGLQHSTRTLTVGMNRMLGSMALLGFIGRDSGGIMNAIYRAMMVTYAMMMLYSAYRSIVSALTIKESSLAAAETSAMLASVVGAPNVAMAVAGTAMFYAGFQLGSGAWTLPPFDTTNALERRSAIRNAQSRM